MRAYRLSVKLKLGLILAAGLISVASLVYTSQLVHQLKERETAIIRLWADAIAYQLHLQPANPYRVSLRRLEEWVQRHSQLTPAARDSLLEALRWAQSMPESGELNFIVNKIIVPDPFQIPAIITDSTNTQIITYRNVAVDSSWSPERQRAYLLRLVERWDRVHEPILITAYGLKQRVHYGESELVTRLRTFPYVQLMFVALFILVGYLGFSYVRKSEQSSLWVGMAKEAAHQLGTPLSSMMGWLELLRAEDLDRGQTEEILAELEKDVQRLQRVASRFSDIGSMPRLEVVPVASVLENVAQYIRRRIPAQGKQVILTVEAPAHLAVPLNVELFEWVIENLLKNALDAIEQDRGEITVRAYAEDQAVIIDVSDTGKGIERRQWKNIFRPGYSTKKRGWGLGLSLARRIVEDYHGGILMLAESKPGQGSTFRIVLFTDRPSHAWKRLWRRWNYLRMRRKRSR